MDKVATSNIFYTGNTPAKQPVNKLRWLIIFLILAALATAAIIILPRILNPNPADPAASNLKIIFDETSPIPMKLNDQNYGYISPKDGATVIEARYTSAERFYGEYAKVATGSPDNPKYQIINRKGEVKLQAATDAEYLAPYGLWRVDDAFYDAKLSRITADHETAYHAGQGFISALSEDNTRQRILNSAGEEVYTCGQAPCSIVVSGNFNGNHEYHAAVQNNASESLLINLQDGSEILQLEPTQYFSIVSEGIYAVNNREGATEKYLLVLNGKIRQEFPPTVNLNIYHGQNVLALSSYSADGALSTQFYDINSGETLNSPRPEWESVKLYPSQDYTISLCDDGKYSLRRGAETIFNCEYPNIMTLPEPTFTYFSSEKRQDLFVVANETTAQLFDARNKKVVRELDEDAVTFYENSPFYATPRKIFNLNHPQSELTLTNPADPSCFNNYCLIGDSFYDNSFKKLGSGGV
jgi:hypothetical protein